MDEDDLPTAEELGVSQAEYARILKGLQQRGKIRAPLVEPRPPGRGARWVPGVLAAVVAAAVVLPRLGLVGGGGDPEPTYAFLDATGEQPIAYSSCRLIQVAVYPAGGPPDAEQLVRQAVARVRDATGLDIVVTGAYGGHAPNWNFEAAPFSSGDPVSVSWQADGALKEMTDHVAGLGGSPVMTSPSGTRYRVAGTIALSRDYYQLLSERGDHAEALAILLHEFGHVVGLDHVDSPRELMYDGAGNLFDYGPGDLQGLRRLGQGPCI